MEPPINRLSAIEEQQTQKQLTMDGFLAKKQLESQPIIHKPIEPVNQLLPQLVHKQGRAIKNKPASQINFYKPLKDAQQETLANLIYVTINQMREEGKKTISLANARRITLMQPEIQVRAALNLIQRRKMVINPTGFLMTILRSTSPS